MKAQLVSASVPQLQGERHERELSGKEKVGEHDGSSLTLEPAAVARSSRSSTRKVPAGAHDGQDHDAADRQDGTDDDACDYRDVDGVKVPFKVRLANAVEIITMTSTKSSTTSRSTRRCS